MGYSQPLSGRENAALPGMCEGQPLVGKNHLTLWVIVFFTLGTFPLLAQETSELHSGSSSDLSRRREVDTKVRNDKYFELCGKAPDFSLIKESSKSNHSLDSKTQAAYDLLRSKCASCHNSGSTAGANTFSDILNIRELISRSILTPGSPDKSALIDRVEDGSMPVGGPELNKTEKEILKDWIQSGAETFSPDSATVPDVGFISNDDLEACMLKDLKEQQSEDRPFIRYLSLGNLYNSNRKGELERTRLAVNKLLNSLSWKKDIKNPVVIDGTQTLIRIDLRNYRWTSEMWEEIGLNNPYPEKIEGPKLTSLSQMTRTRTPFVRADWLVFKASRPPLYHKLLFDLPKISPRVGAVRADKALENLLSVNAAENLREGNVVKAGFRQSNVTKSNRTIERHETPFGGYWKSDDFTSRVGRQNIFDHPTDYVKDGGEYIFSLPNGLHGYLITDAAGNRLDGAPTNVVVDPNRIQKDGVVLNGVSCMNCHQRGMKRQDDDVLEYFTQLEEQLKNGDRIRLPADLPVNDKGGGINLGVDTNLRQAIREVKKVYKGNKTLNEVYTRDEADFKTAIEKTGNSVEVADPVFATANQFEAPLDLKSIASELGQDPQVVEEFFRTHLDVRQRLGLGKASIVDRDVFNAQFIALKEALRRYRPSKGYAY